MNKLLYFILLLFLFNNIANAEILNNNLFFKNVKDKNVIFIDKQEKTLYFYEIIDDLPVEKFKFDSILLGEIEGNKEVEGDKKTPEGIYYIKTFIPGKKLAPIYGLGAFPLNYPNFFDKKDGKTGHGIWIHGVNDNENKDFTQGCVAIQNNQLEKLKKLNIINSTVIIAPKATFATFDSYNAERINWLNYLNTFLKSWENNDIEKFSNFIHIDFSNKKNQDRKLFLKHKQNLMKIYPYKKIEAISVEIYKENNQNIIIYTQNYCAPNILVTGKKTLYLQKEATGWKIIGEDFKKLPLSFHVKNKVLNFLDNWKHAWESKDIDSYINFYHQDFKSKKKNLNDWKIYKKEKFEKANDILLDISNVRVKTLSPIKYSVTFKQKYKTDNYSDIGLKHLILYGCPGDFKIISETWSPLK